jgi:glycosyltransferase involved in cell wall biosynthesis
MWAGRRFCELTARRIGDRCGSVYAFSSAAKELFEHAHEIGARTCLDHATAPFAYERALVQEEYQRFSGWALDEEPDSLIARYDQRQREELFLADTVVCGSSFIREAIVAQGVDSGKMRVVPLGISERFFRLRRHPKTGDRALRVLFIGDDGLRKGIGYLARAAARLRPLKVNVRVVGDLKISEKGLGELRESVELMGPVPRKDIDALLSWADVLALPSVSDTFGLVVLEAMAAGVPVIATPHTCAPDVIRDGVDGFIVPIRDEEAIAIKLDRIAGDADLLHEMSVNARARALDFTLDHYADRLVHATSN